MNFECGRCQHRFNFKANLIAHLKRKGICEPVDDGHNVCREKLVSDLCPTKVSNVTPFIDFVQLNVTEPANNTCFKCKFCDKVYKHASNKSTHQKSCIARQKERDGQSNNAERQAIDVEKLKEELKEEISKQTDNIILKLRQEIDDLRRHATGNTGNIGTTNNITTQNNYIVNAFGQESLNHLTHASKKQHIMNLKESIPQLIKSIHFNPDLPENYNIRQLSNKQNKLQFFDGCKWLPCDRSNTLDKLIEKGHRILYSFFLENQLSDADLKLRAETIMGYYQSVGLFKEKKEYLDVKRELYMLFCQDNAVFVLDNIH